MLGSPKEITFKAMKRRRKTDYQLVSAIVGLVLGVAMLAAGMMSLSQDASTYGTVSAARRRMLQAEEEGTAVIPVPQADENKPRTTRTYGQISREKMSALPRGLLQLEDLYMGDDREADTLYPLDLDLHKDQAEGHTVSVRAFKQGGEVVPNKYFVYLFEDGNLLTFTRGQNEQENIWTLAEKDGVFVVDIDSVCGDEICLIATSTKSSAFRFGQGAIELSAPAVAEVVAAPVTVETPTEETDLIEPALTGETEVDETPVVDQEQAGQVGTGGEEHVAIEAEPAIEQPSEEQAPETAVVLTEQAETGGEEPAASETEPAVEQPSEEQAPETPAVLTEQDETPAAGGEDLTGITDAELTTEGEEAPPSQIIEQPPVTSEGETEDRIVDQEEEQAAETGGEEMTIPSGAEEPAPVGEMFQRTTGGEEMTIPSANEEPAPGASASIEYPERIVGEKYSRTTGGESEVAGEPAFKKARVTEEAGEAELAGGDAQAVTNGDIAQQSEFELPPAVEQAEEKEKTEVKPKKRKVTGFKRRNRDEDVVKKTTPKRTMKKKPAAKEPWHPAW